MASTPPQNFLPTVRENQFLPPISRWMTLGGLFIVGCVGLVVTLASVTKYKISVKAAATVRPAGELRIVQATTEGTVTRVLVVENQEVKKGDVLAVINNSRIQTKKSQLQSNIQQAQLQLAQLNAQIRAIDTQILAETERNKRAIASAEAELSRRNREYRDTKITAAADVEEAEANFKQAQSQLQKAHAEFQSNLASLRSALASFKAAKSRRDRYKPLAKSGAFSLNQLEEAQLTVEQQEQAVELQKGVLSAQKQEIERQREVVKSVYTRIKRAKAATYPSQSEVVIAFERIYLEKASGQATLATINRERESLIQQRIEIEKQRLSDVRELQQVQIDLSQTVISAPDDGILFKLNLRNSGQSVRTGEEIAQVAPNKTQILIKALVAAQDIGKVKKGQKAQLQVSACPYPDYGTVKGVVSSISPDAIIPQSNSDSTITHTTVYEVMIEPESLSLNQGNKKCTIQLGMEGRVDIISTEESCIQFLLRQARLIIDS